MINEYNAVQPHIAEAMEEHKTALFAQESAKLDKYMQEHKVLDPAVKQHGHDQLSLEQSYRNYEYQPFYLSSLAQT